MPPALLPEAPPFSIEAFLALERDKDLLRFSTAGSVDDGKSTLIGRLLYDTQSVYDDHVLAIQGKGATAPGQIDFALLTDGLRAEREQGITIDVAYRYFSTAKRKFIIADTPGHEQYTRNMATGASTADAAVVLIDARKGVLPQSRRHAYIASLLGVRHIVVAVNKMDLVGYSQTAFREIESDFSKVLAAIGADTGMPVAPVFVPVSALAGDNVVHRSGAMPWYSGPSLLAILEELPPLVASRNAPFRFPVQRVLRPDQSFRGFAGQIASGTVRVGDALTVLPSGRNASVTRIVTYDGDLEEAPAPLSVTLVLDHEVDISRGDLLVSAQAPATVAQDYRAALVWMDQSPLDCSRRYLLKQTSQTVPVVIATVEYRANITTLVHETVETLEMNGIGVVPLRLLRPIALERYAENRGTGAFILIDPESNGTVAAGMVLEILGPARGDSSISAPSGPVSEEERISRWGHRGGVLALSGPAPLIDSLERNLFAAGGVTVRNSASEQLEQLPLLTQAGLLVLDITAGDAASLTASANGRTITVDATQADAAIAAIRELLQHAGILMVAAPHPGKARP